MSPIARTGAKYARDDAGGPRHAAAIGHPMAAPIAARKWRPCRREALAPDSANRRASRVVRS
jgi:hypothetical protein